VAMKDGEVSVVTDVVHLCYHQFGVIDGGGNVPVRAAQRTNALVDVYEGAAVVATGIHTGVVTVTTEARPTPPASIELDPWDEVVDVTVAMPGGDGRLVVLMADVPATFGCLTPTGPGTYRLRAHARGRDTAIDGTAFEPFEHYRLVLWPAPPAPQVIHKETDRYGAGWHSYDPTAPPRAPLARDEGDPARHEQHQTPQPGHGRWVSSATRPGLPSSADREAPGLLDGSGRRKGMRAVRLTRLTGLGDTSNSSTNRAGDPPSP